VLLQRHRARTSRYLLQEALLFVYYNNTHSFRVWSPPDDDIVSWNEDKKQAYVLDVTALLLERGVDPNAVGVFRNEDRMVRCEHSPLCTALKHNNDALVERLLEGGADPNVRSGQLHDCHPLTYLAVLPDPLPALERFLALVKKYTPHQKEPLLTWNEVLFLVKRKEYGHLNPRETFLMCAVRANDRRLMTFLKTQPGLSTHSAPPAERIHNPFASLKYVMAVFIDRPLYEMLSVSQQETRDWIAENLLSDPNVELEWENELQDVDMPRDVYEKTPQDRRSSALRLAIHTSQDWIVKRLIQDPRMNVNTAWPLFVAADMGRVDIIEYMMQQRDDLDVTVTDLFGNTVFHYMNVERNTLNTSEMEQVYRVAIEMVKRGADVRARNYEQEPAGENGMSALRRISVLLHSTLPAHIVGHIIKMSTDTSVFKSSE